MARPFTSEPPRIVIQEYVDLPAPTTATSQTALSVPFKNHMPTTDKADLAFSRPEVSAKETDVSITSPDVSTSEQPVPINSPAWIDKMKRQFLALDIDRDGYITEDDVILLASTLASMKKMTEQQEADILKELRGVWLFGQELEGGISFHWAQFLESMRTFVVTPTARQRVRSYGEFLFRIIDTNRDGSASKEEVKGLVLGGGMNFTLTEGLFENIEKDSDKGDVTLQEWLKGLEDFMFTDKVG